MALISRQVACQVRVPAALFCSLLAVACFPWTARGAGAEGKKLLLSAAYSSMAASSTREDPASASLTYAPENILDQEERSAWCASREMLGVGEWIEVGMLIPFALSRIGIVGTIPPPPEKKNVVLSQYPYARIKKIRITNPIGEFRDVDLFDLAQMQYADFSPPLKGDRFRVKVESLYAGTERVMTCIGELELWGETQGEGATVDDLARKAIEADVRHVFGESFSGQRASLAGPILKSKLSNLFTRYNNFIPISVARIVASYELPESLAKMPENGRPEDSACVVALRALYESNPYAKRYLREQYAVNAKAPLGAQCGLPSDPLYWVLKGHKDAIPLFWRRKDFHALLEVGDERALEPFLAAFQGERAVYHWWEKPSGWHGPGDLSPQELLNKLAGPYRRDVLSRLLERHGGEAGYYRDGLKALAGLKAN